MTIAGRGMARRSMASGYWWLGQRRNGVACAGEDSGEVMRRWQSFLATRGVAPEQELASGGAATATSGDTVAAAERTEEEEGGGNPRVLSAITGTLL
jgi:hypothetical protein